jgi:DNA polymerase I-like protein with 3'-5' exonuclease and polymerase domains
MSKEEQTTFGENDPYSDEQILYAGGDVVYLGSIRRQQISEMRAEDQRVNQAGRRGLMKTMWWENEFVKCVADMEMEGVRIDKDKWYSIEDEVMPIFEQEQLELNSLVLRDLKHVLIENDWIGLEDEVVTNVWSSTKKKKELIQHVYGTEIEKTSKAELKKFLEANDPNFPEELRGKLNTKAWREHSYPVGGEDEWIIIKLMILLDKSTQETIKPALDKCLIENYKEFLKEQGWFRGKDEVTVNWASPPQRLAIFQGIDPTIESTSKDIIADFVDDHPIFPHYLKYAEVAHQIKSFGKSFYDKHVEIDGKIRTRFRQILATGRLSSTNPSLLNMPNAQVYRNCFIADEGFEIFGADYAGEELVVTATLANEQIWLDALQQGKDLHSINAQLIFGDRWEAAAEPDCQFAIDQRQCKCPKHKELRGQSKAVSFGSIYGISAPKLAFNLKISVEEAAQILKNFFAGLPNIQVMMDKFGRFALVHGYILEPVFGRIRYFDKWKLNNPREHAGIERASYNSPIQSTGSSILKIAAVLMRRWIYQNNHQDNIKLQLPVHDEFMGQARPAYMTLAKEKLEYFMELAGKLAGFPLSADAASGVSWGEVH